MKHKLRYNIILTGALMYTTEQLFSYLDDLAGALNSGDIATALEIQGFIYEMLDTAEIKFDVSVPAQ